MTSAFPPDRPDIVDELLEGLEHDDAAALSPVLNELKALSTTAPVTPGPELAALLSAGASRTADATAVLDVVPETAPQETVARERLATVVDLDAVRAARTGSPATAVRSPGAGRPRRRRRVVLAATLAAVAATAAAAGVAAASQDGGIPRLIQIITGQTPEQPAPPVPSRPQPAPRPTEPAPVRSAEPAPSSPVVPAPRPSGTTAPTPTPAAPRLPVDPGVVPTLPKILPDHLVPSPLPSDLPLPDVR